MSETPPQRPTSVPVPHQSQQQQFTLRSPPSLLRALHRPSHTFSSASDDFISSTSTGTGTGNTGRKQRRELGIQETLRRQVDGVVKRRSGGVLGRGYILKTDHYPTGRALDLSIEVQGAPNFRAPDEDGLNVFGVAQPTVPGLKSILTILGCQPSPLPNPGSRRPSANMTASSAAGGAGVRMGPPLEKTMSQPASTTGAGSGNSPKGRGAVLHEEGQAVWFSTREETLVYCNGRPYVLRDASVPFRTLTLSNRAPNLEDIERRLKLDILEEARRYGGMILFHDEVETGHLVPTWMSVDEHSIRTPREVWEHVKNQGWRVEYFRIPIAPDTPIEDNYLDAYVSALKSVDPQNTSLVFNCGMGVVRTTFAMVAASLMRRKQLLMQGYEDAFPQAVAPSGMTTPAGMSGAQQASQLLEHATQQQALNKSLLQMTRLLDKNLSSRHVSAVDLLGTQPNLLEQMRKAHMGNYQIVLALISSLDGGRQIKRLVDEVIDCCAAVVNLREHVLEYRIRYSVASLDDKTRQLLLEKALRSLEQYFDLIVFAAYVEEEEAGTTGKTFSAWLMNRPEIWKYVGLDFPLKPDSQAQAQPHDQDQEQEREDEELSLMQTLSQIKIMRRQGGNRLFSFAPVNDLSLISRSSELTEGRYGDAAAGERAREQDVQGGRVLGDEWAEHVVTNRSGIMLRASTLLKSDQWLTDMAASVEGVRGAVGFRQVPGSSVFTTGQPTQDAISIILNQVHGRCSGISQIAWICLREEPLVMINGFPYCLRRDGTALRNIRDYTGVSASRLEVLEERLKSDVINELQQFQGRLLLHSESTDGQVIPVWESVETPDVESVREVMDEVSQSTEGVRLMFYRVPVTSESSPDFHDITELLDICMRTDIDRTAFVLNDQLGRGRSSTTAVMLLLIQRWLRWSRTHSARSSSTAPNTPIRERSRPGTMRRLTQNQVQSASPRATSPTSATASVFGGTAATTTTTTTTTAPGRTSWQIINSCLRVIKNGTEVKRVVDEAIDAAAAHFNLRDAIQDFRLKAEEAKDAAERDSYVEKGIYHLRRYFHLLVFQAYLDNRTPDEESPYSFESFVKHRPVFKTLETELEHGGLAGLTPLDRMDVADGMALPDEVSQVVANRSGGILSAQTILKSDFFSGLQKQSLPDRVDGAANYRQATLVYPVSASAEEGEQDGGDQSKHFVYGTGMPSGPGLRNALKRMGGAPGGERKVVWTSLREEPVLYVKARPHVLRLVDKPLTNVETTGVTAAVVERMEQALKQDVLKEIRAGKGRLLLHDEVETKPGNYEIIPIWETLDEKEVMTPRELYEAVVKEQYEVDYLRVAITDEQAPLPGSLQVIVKRVVTGIKQGSDFVFNCQMGRGRTTTGMCVASLIATIEQNSLQDLLADDEDEEEEGDQGLDQTQYLNGEYKTILQLVTVLSHGKDAKRITDKVINMMEGVQNLRKAVYDFKLKYEAAPAGSAKQKTLLHQGANYLYRYGTLIVLTNFLLESKEQNVPLEETDFVPWMQKHREIRSVLSRKDLD